MTWSLFCSYFVVRSLFCTSVQLSTRQPCEALPCAMARAASVLRGPIAGHWWSVLVIKEFFLASVKRSWLQARACCHHHRLRESRQRLCLLVRYLQWSQILWSISLNVSACLYLSIFFLLKICLEYWNWAWTLTRELLISQVCTPGLRNEAPCPKVQDGSTWSVILNLFLPAPNTSMLLTKGILCS